MYRVYVALVTLALLGAALLESGQGEAHAAWVCTPVTPYATSARMGFCHNTIVAFPSPSPTPTVIATKVVIVHPVIKIRYRPSIGLRYF